LIIKVPSIVTVKWGKDKFKFKAFQVRIKWDAGSFVIEGLFNPDVINIGESNGRNSEEVKRDR
jgi:hypothetical protein